MKHFRLAIQLSCVFLLCVGLGLWTTMRAASETNTAPLGTAFAFEAITVSTTAVGFTAATISPTNGPGAKSAFCSVEAQPIRYREFGTPTAAVGGGHPALAAADLTVVGLNNMLTFRAIRSGASDATLTCTYFR